MNFASGILSSKNTHVCINNYKHLYVILIVEALLLDLNVKKDLRKCLFFSFFSSAQSPFIVLSFVSLARGYYFQLLDHYHFPPSAE